MSSILNAGEWAFFNLIVACLAFVCFLVLAIVLLSRTTRNPEKLQRQGNYLPWLFISIFAAMVGIFLFTLFQNLGGKQVFFDKWSVTQVLLFCIQILTGVKTLKGNISNKQTEQADSEEGNSEDFSARPAPASVRTSKRLKLRSDSAVGFENDQERR